MTKLPICVLYAEKALHQNQVAWKWFTRFRSDNFDVKDESIIELLKINELMKFLKKFRTLNLSALLLLVCS